MNSRPSCCGLTKPRVTLTPPSSLPHRPPQSAEKPPKAPSASKPDSAAPRDGAAAAAAPQPSEDGQAPRRLLFDDEALDEGALRALVEDYNRSLAEQGLAHRQVELAPAAPQPSSARAATPLSAAAAGAAAWPQALSAGGPAAVGGDADAVRRMQSRISQLEAQVARAGTGAGAAAAPLPAGALYVTHKEMELVQENHALRQQLQHVMQDGWVTATRGSTGPDGGAGDVHASQELWVPATSLAAAPWATPPSGGRAGGGILTGVSPLRAFGSGGGAARFTPASEGSVKTGHTPGSGGARGGGPRPGGPVSLLPPLRAGSLAAGSAAGSPSRGSSSGTPRERMAAVLHDSRTKIEQLALNLTVGGWAVA